MISDTTTNKVVECKSKITQNENLTVMCETTAETNKDILSESKPELNLNGKMMKFSESRKSPIVGSFTPMTYHSTPNKEGVPLTKTMVNQQLHPSRHSDNKKTIELHTDGSKKLNETNKKDFSDKEETELGVNKDIRDKVTDNKIEKQLDNTCKDNHTTELTKDDENALGELNQTLDNKDDRGKLVDVTCKSECEVDSPKTMVKVIQDTETSNKNLTLTVLPQLDNTIPVCDDVTKKFESNLNKKSKDEKGDEDILDKKRDISENVESTKEKLTADEKVIKEKSVLTSEKITSQNEQIKSESDIVIQKDELECVPSQTMNNTIISQEGNNQITISDINDKNGKALEDIQKVESVFTVPNLTNIELKRDQNVDSNSAIINVVDKLKSNEIDQYKNTVSSEICKEKLVTDNSSIDKAVHNNSMETVKDNQPDNLKDDCKNKNEEKRTKSIGDSKTFKMTTDLEKHEITKLVTPLNTREDIIENEIAHPLKKNNDNKQKTNVSDNNGPEVTSKNDKNVIITNTIVNQLIKSNDNVCPKESQSKDKSDVIKTNEKKEGILGKQTIKTESSLSSPENSRSNTITVGKVGLIAEKKVEVGDKKDIPTDVIIEQKRLNNNHAPVPFGQWTEANRQEFLNKFKESKPPVNSSNGKQIKNSNDLNRRDVLKKIDSQRQSSNAAAKAQDTIKSSLKNETMFVNKTTTLGQEVIDPAKIEMSYDLKQKPTIVKKLAKPEALGKNQEEKKTESKNFILYPESTTPSNPDANQKKDFINAQDIIDITIEDMIHRNLPSKHPEEGKQSANKNNTCTSYETPYDDIEMKMNELHGIPFVERPPHELPNVPDAKNLNKLERGKLNKTTKIPNVIPFPNKISKKSVLEYLTEVDSEEEVIEHVPITGDIDVNNKSVVKELHPSTDAEKKEAIITENEFDKFARRNSVTYENCLTVNFDSKEPHNVVQTVVEKDIPKKYSKNDMVRFDIKSKLPQKNTTGRQNTQTNKIHSAKSGAAAEDPSNKQYQSKLQIAYQSALTAKRQLECPITIIEDKPVKVVFIDSNAEYIPSQLNVQGQELSPAKNKITEPIAVSIGTCDSLDSDVLESTDDSKSQDSPKMKPKHQRKQVLTPVEPDLELIQPGDLGIEVSPKKKRKTEEIRHDKHSKNLIHKKSYLLGRTTEDKILNVDLSKTLKDASNKGENFHREPVSAIDSLVKAAELLENQTENMNTNTAITPNPDNQQMTPVKRGRGRPRKYPLPEGADKNKIPSPQKKPKLIDAKSPKVDTTTEDEETTDDEIVKENWTMGKINENIVCPICNKLFRSENVVFKHVKHCTGVSPSRSEPEKRSPRRIRQSQESESKSEDMDIDDDKPISSFTKKETIIKRASKDSVSDVNKDEVIVIDDTPVKDNENKEKLKKSEKDKPDTRKRLSKIPKIQSLVCEFCGKTFRQNSYLVSHKIQHMKVEKKTERESNATDKSVFTCEVCKKAFRKLHHLVQHRLIHNNALPSRVLRKSSSEQSNGKTKEQEMSKQNDDPSAGFRCEPCDKSFRKLHHLVEHRETHDGINRQKTTTIIQSTEEKPSPPPPECDICKKTFRKLHHLIEHKEQHNETSSENSDDKSVKSTLSTKDIIHECSLCYMVFPNEHSLNKHTIICQRKKRQSKQAKSTEGSENLVDAKSTEGTEDLVDAKQEEAKFEVNDSFDDTHMKGEKSQIIEKNEDIEHPKINLPEQLENEIEIIETSPVNVIEIKSDDGECTISKPELIEAKTTAITSKDVCENEKGDNNEKPKKVNNEKQIKVRETPKKKTPLKDKVAPTVTKRKKTIDLPLPVVDEVKPAIESSDDDEIRYMLNPDFKEDTSEDKLFIKVRAKKRNSLQIERPTSKDLVKRRISLQHPPKIPRKLNKPDTKVASTSKNTLKTSKLDPVPSTDSDDSDIKYSLPKSVALKTKSAPTQTIKVESLTPKKLTNKRKSLSSIAKRKSLGKTIVGRPKAKASPVKYVKTRK